MVKYQYYCEHSFDLANLANTLLQSVFDVDVCGPHFENQWLREPDLVAELR
jgi:hypothetical protein